MKENNGTTRREFLKTAAGLGMLALAQPLATGCGGGPRRNSADYSRTIAETTAFMEQQMAANDVTGAAIALVDDQRVVWEQGFGYADAARGVAVTSDTLFGIGSASKTFTAAMVMQLVDRGLVSLDDPLTKYIPRFSVGAPLAPSSSGGGAITIRTILTQHSGIPGDEMWYGIFAQAPHPEFNSRVLDYLPGDRAQFPPDYFFAYSNAAVGLLADVIAAAARMPFVDYSNAFLRSLGMNHSSFDRDDPSVALDRPKRTTRVGSTPMDT
jgi:CubicO group peptidase (beta-lactamase class C family)